MGNSLKPSLGHTGLLVIDVQQKLAAAMPEADRQRCIRHTSTLVQAAGLFKMPVLVTEQYPKGLGPTVPEVSEQLSKLKPTAPVLAKMDFDATADSGFGNALDHLSCQGREEGAIRTLVVVGMESHICVYQTVRGLISYGFQVQVPWDATCSRDPQNVDVARNLWAQSGAVVTSTETLLFDLLGRAGGEEFKIISRLIR